MHMSGEKIILVKAALSPAILKTSDLYYIAGENL